MPSLPKGKKKKWIASSKKTTGFTEKHKSDNYDFYNSRSWRQLREGQGIQSAGGNGQ